MMNEVRSLIKIKPIIALTMTATFVYLVVSGSIAPEVSVSIISPVILAYFGSKNDNK